MAGRPALLNPQSNLRRPYRKVGLRRPVMSAACSILTLRTLMAIRRTRRRREGIDAETANNNDEQGDTKSNGTL